MPAERVAVLGVLRLEVLGAVLADDLDPRLDEQRHVGERDVLRRRDDGHVRPDLLPAPARSARGSRSGDSTDHPLHAARAAVAAVREEELGVARACRGRRARPLATPAARSARSAARQQVELAVRSSGRRRSAPTPRRRPRSSTARSPARRSRPSRPVAERRDARLDDAVREAAPAGVQHRERAARRRVRAIAIGRQSADEREHRQARLVGPEAVALLAAPPGAARCTVGECTWRLNASRSGSSAERRAREAPVLLDAAPGRRRCRASRFSDSYDAVAHAADRVVNATT